MASSSWNAPLVTRCVSEEPARRRRGKALAEELPIYKVTLKRKHESLEMCTESSRTVSQNDREAHIVLDEVLTYTSHRMQHARPTHNQAHPRSSS